MIPSDTAQIEVLVHRPHGEEVLPAVVLVHGGSFAFGSTHDHAHFALAKSRAESGYVVVDVEYRLAPEYPFPAALNDVVAAIRWVRDSASQLRIRPDAILADGISSGGGLAAGAALVLRDAGEDALAGLVLECPSIDLRPSAAWREEFQQWNSLPRRDVVRSIYLQDTAPDHPRASPACEESLDGLPPVHIATAEVDPLTPAAENFAARLREASVPVTVSRHLGVTHGSFLIRGLASSAEWEADVAAAFERMRG
ncbi:alpha/beta hydrolase fold domain-containing protein [Microbacterium sp. E-13]|uniref:alpha/beta hydrolase fold domain-containing protein n=1 Tax=Microbacterium sp. E-13 TaxID=3404048 RepID=UPI003CEA16A4